MLCKTELLTLGSSKYTTGRKPIPTPSKHCLPGLTFSSTDDGGSTFVRNDGIYL
jgi:hypothetical protein